MLSDFIIKDDKLLKYNGKDSKVIVPDGIKKINDDCFRNCSTLTSIIMPKSVVSIGSFAFSRCSALTNITISNGLKIIGDGAFFECNSLKKVNYTGTVDDWCEIIFDSIFANPINFSNSLYINDELVVNAGIFKTTQINPFAFFKCKSLRTVTIGKNVMLIGQGAFAGCSDQLTIKCETKKPFIGLPKGWDKKWMGNCKANVLWGI